MPSELPRLMIRMEKKLIDKLRYIAEHNGRSMNKESRLVLFKYIQQFEKRYGEIKVD